MNTPAEHRFAFGALFFQCIDPDCSKQFAQLFTIHKLFVAPQLHHHQLKILWCAHQLHLWRHIWPKIIYFVHPGRFEMQSFLYPFVPPLIVRMMHFALWRFWPKNSRKFRDESFFFIEKISSAWLCLDTRQLDTLVCKTRYINYIKRTVESIQFSFSASISTPHYTRLSLTTINSNKNIN